VHVTLVMPHRATTAHQRPFRRCDAGLPGCPIVGLDDLDLLAENASLRIPLLGSRNRVGHFLALFATDR
jgi:hypothetical protein